MTTPVRLQKYIADCGVTSRRKAEDLIVARQVKVNGKTVSELGSKVIPGVDLVQVHGETIDIAALERIYIILNKPRAIMSTVSDPEGRRTVVDLCKGIKSRIYPVGRLDYHSEGLMIMTNDGDLTQKLMHPKFEVTKVYEVKVFGVMTEGLLNKIRDGIHDGGDFLKPISVRVIKQLAGKTWLEFRLNEGKNREIRRLCEACGLTIDKLRRVAIGNLSLDGLSPGDFRVLTRKELLKSIGLNSKGEKVKDFDYVSPKKTVNKRKRQRFKTSAPKADDQSFVKFRKEHYLVTVKAKEPLKKVKEDFIQLS